MKDKDYVSVKIKPIISTSTLSLSEDVEPLQVDVPTPTDFWISCKKVYVVGYPSNDQATAIKNFPSEYLSRVRKDIATLILERQNVEVQKMLQNFEQRGRETLLRQAESYLEKGVSTNQLDKDHALNILRSIKQSTEE